MNQPDSKEIRHSKIHHNLINKMIFDGIILIAYIGGGIFFFFGTLPRYYLHRDKPFWLFHMLRLVDCRQPSPDISAMLLQYTGIVWLLLGTMYGVLMYRYAFPDIWGDIFAFSVSFGPGLLFAGKATLLKRKYW